MRGGDRTRYYIISCGRSDTREEGLEVLAFVPIHADSVQVRAVQFVRPVAVCAI